ncbi:MAG: alkaline phosphatase D family protein [Planctomycetota bacterium]
MTAARLALSVLAALLALGALLPGQTPDRKPVPDRVWLGPDLWANRLQDWAVENGRRACVDDRGLPLRTAHLVSGRLDATRGDFRVRIELGRRQGDPEHAAGAFAGLLLGCGGAERSGLEACLVHAWTGPGTGIFAGLDADGRPVIRDLDPNGALGEEPPSRGEAFPSSARIEVRYDAARGVLRVSRLPAASGEGDPAPPAAEKAIPASRLVGNLALASHPGPKKRAVRHWFDELDPSGDGIILDRGRQLHALFATQYTLSRGTLTLTAQLFPDAFGPDSSVAFEVEGEKGYVERARTGIEPASCTATFRLEDWDDTRRRNVRLVYRRDATDGYSCSRTASIASDPAGRRELRLVATNCLHQNAHLLGGPRTDWTKQVWFPHADLVARVAAQEPDLLFFAGDQIYEGASPTFADRRELRLDYLYKWSLWCLTWRELTQRTPAVVIPDDHDVYQGNLWGEGGRSAKRDHFGGYVHPAWFVRLVERTQTSHLPPPVDARPIDQDIGVYFTELRWGRVSFAILEDRKFKSGCAREGMPPSGTGRPDHFNDPEFDRGRLDRPGLTLLGERQLAFLDGWARDWNGVDFKVALSQTPLANLATHHGGKLGFLLADLDSNGWPQSGRRRAVEALRRASAVHVCGDQHLASLVRHGLDRHRDAIWGFCAPASANFYPRAWFPGHAEAYRKPSFEEFGGDRLDGFGNLVSVYAAANPGGPSHPENPLLHDGMPGWGTVTFFRDTGEVEFGCWPRLADPAKGPQYEGWPRRVVPGEIDGPAGVLGPFALARVTRPLVEVRRAGRDELLFARRFVLDAKTPVLRVPVPEDGAYDLVVVEPETGRRAEIGDRRPAAPDAAAERLELR